MSAIPIILSRGLASCHRKSVVKKKPGHRVVLHLDPRMALEAIILNRLERTPAVRRQEWLRGLLVQGFRSECLALRGAVEKGEPRSTTAFTQWLAREASGMIAVKEDPLKMQTRGPQVKAEGKPFAALGKVIG